MIMTENKPQKLRVVVGYDFSVLAENALAMAGTLCSRFTSELHVVAAVDESLRARQVVDSVDYRNAAVVQERLMNIVKAVPARFDAVGVDVYTHARIGDPADVIIGLANDVRADMILVGTHGYSGVKRMLLGSVAEAVTRDAHCPVMCVRPTDYHELDKTTVPRVEPPGPAMDHYIEPHIYEYRPAHRIDTKCPPAWPLW
jgi:nucleotide-binding universal stress UspA family protein